MSTEEVRWNDATSVRVPKGLQRIFPQICRKYEPVDLIDKEKRYLQRCNKAQILVADVNYHTETGMKQLERRLQKHLCGGLSYRFMTTEKLLSIAYARHIDVPYQDTWHEPDHVQLIQRIQESDAAAGPFKLLELPPELRTQIFSYVVLSEYETSYSPGPVLPDFPPLLFVNQQIRREAGKIFMQSRPIVLPCTIHSSIRPAYTMKQYSVTISAPEESLEWLRMAGVDLLPRIRSCLLVHRVTGVLYRSYVYDTDPIGGTNIFKTHLLGQIEGDPLLDNRGLYLLDLETSIQSQLRMGPKDVGELKFDKMKTDMLVKSIQSWEKQTEEDKQYSEHHGAALILNWI